MTWKKKCEISTTLTTNEIHLNIFTIALADGLRAFNGIIL